MHTTKEANHPTASIGDGARSGGDPFVIPPLAYQIAQYFRMVYADNQPVSGPEGDDYSQAIDDLGEAIWAGLHTKEYRQMARARELYQAADHLHEAARKMYFGLEGGRDESRRAAAHVRDVLREIDTGSRAVRADQAFDEPTVDDLRGAKVPDDTLETVRAERDRSEREVARLRKIMRDTADDLSMQRMHPEQCAFILQEAAD